MSYRIPWFVRFGLPVVAFTMLGVMVSFPNPTTVMFYRSCTLSLAVAAWFVATESLVRVQADREKPFVPILSADDDDEPDPEREAADRKEGWVPVEDLQATTIFYDGREQEGWEVPDGKTFRRFEEALNYWSDKLRRQNEELP